MLGTGIYRVRADRCSPLVVCAVVEIVCAEGLVGKVSFFRSFVLRERFVFSQKCVKFDASFHSFILRRDRSLI